MTTQRTIAFERYQPRPIRFLELWSAVDWRLKVYGIAYGRSEPRDELVAAAKQVALARLASVPAPVPDAAEHYSVGFLGIHDGRTANFVFVSYWANENELYHHVYVSPTAEPARLEYVTPTGLTVCVWDLRVLAFERDAWLDTVLRNPAGPDLQAYLQQRLNDDA